MKLILYQSRLWTIYQETRNSYKISRIAKKNGTETKVLDEVPKTAVCETTILKVIE